MKIRVIAPFRLRTKEGSWEFSKGEHTVGNALAKHPVMKAWLIAGRYEVIAEEKKADDTKSGSEK